ncbi:MAG: sugar phosphate isomerase/epimerase [Acidobacteriia bacterium]|nr:sugar phosphate isomerase/epimerase [Terriglobia bacterium]
MQGAVLGALAAEAQAQQQPREPDKLQWNPPLILFARHLQWTGVEPGIAFAKEAGFDGIGWAVRPGAHIAPDEVEKKLPAAVELTRKAGLSAPFLTTAILDDSSPRAEVIIATMKSAGITSYRAANFRYDYQRDFRIQLQGYSARIARLAKLNEKYSVKALYHTHSYPGLVGGAVWDLWTMIRDFDPRFIGMNYDIGHATVRGGPGWFESAHLARSFIGSVTLKDFQWVHFPVAPFTGRWSPKYCRPGDGIVDFPSFFSYLKEIQFQEPIELYFEYEVYPPGKPAVNLLGTNFGSWKLEIPQADLLAAMRRDLAFYRRIIREVNEL